MDYNNFLHLLPIPEKWKLNGKYIFDMVYNPPETKFIKKAVKENAAQIISGLEMLVNQAAYSFKIWFDILPEDHVINEAKEKIKKWNQEQ